MDNSGTLYDLILEYIKMSAHCCELLQSIIKNDEHPLAAKNQRIIPKEGKIGELSYNFHGVGCYFEYKGGAIDIDFGPDRRCDGFDKSRLVRFFEDMEDKTAFRDLDRNVIEREFQLYADIGLIACPRWVPSEHLYYLASNLDVI